MFTIFFFFFLDLVDAVSESVQRLLSCDQQSVELLSQQALNSLCPALYALLSDGLKPTIETPFGDINNSVWQVVEASSQQGNQYTQLFIHNIV